MGEPGWFLLYVLELNPFDEWNVIFLPEDESGARLLNAPLHPRGSIPDFAASGEAFILERKQVLLKLHAQARRLRSFGAFNEARASAIEDVKALAESFMGRLLEGDRAVGDGPRLPEV